MTETGQIVGRNDNPYFAGDKLVLGDPYIVVYEDEQKTTVQNLTGVAVGDVYWSLESELGRAPVMSTDDAGVNVEFGTKSDGEVRVVIDSGVTDGLKAPYDWYLEITISGDTDTVASGTLDITPK